MPEDASAIAAIAGNLPLSPLAAAFDAVSGPSAVERLLQTGHAFLVAEDDAGVCAFVRRHADEGIAWFDLLASAAPGAGRALVRAVEMEAQEAGNRLVRCRAPEERLGDYFGWQGYMPIAREQDDGASLLVMERRLPLLTVREQRREDAPFISALTGRDSYAFELGARPGWFIAADGDRAVGLTWVADGAGGIGEIATPILLDAYRNRGLETWMLERAAFHASHAGHHAVQVQTDEWLDALSRDLEDQLWHREGDTFVRHFSTTSRDDPDR